MCLENGVAVNRSLTEGHGLYNGSDYLLCIVKRSSTRGTGSVCLLWMNWSAALLHEQVTRGIVPGCRNDVEAVRTGTPGNNSGTAGRG